MKNVRIYGRPKFVDKFNLLNTFFRKHFTKKEWPSFISNFCFNFNKNTYFTNYMEKNIFLKLEFKSSFTTKKYWYTIKDKQQFEMRNEIFVMCFVED